LEDLRRKEQTLETLLRRRVPDWSPEADVTRERVAGILARMLDYEGIARQAMGPDWSKLTDGQRRAFLDRFTALTNRAFIAALSRPNVHLRFDAETLSDAQATITVTTVDASRVPEIDEPAEYRLARKRDHWLIFDVVSDGQSLIDGYHAEFAQMMRRGGFDEVLSRLDRRLRASRRD
jgi:phospholipid transport system substrate-binding protein